VDFKDYYKILGVDRKATDKDIKTAYRKLARKHHPDVNKNDPKSEARFKEINEAYEVLSDAEKRRRYDEIGPDWANFQQRRPPAGPGGPGGVHVNVGGEDVGDFSEFFRTIFGGGGFGGGRSGSFDPESGTFRVRRGGTWQDAGDIFGRGRAAGPEPGQDFETNIELTLDEVLRGTTKALQLSEGGGGPSRRVEVKIPAGVRDGQRVRVAGEGGAGESGGRKGDLYLRVHVMPHPTFERKDDDLEVRFTVPLTTAVLGGEAQVPTLDGPVGIKVPPGSKNGRVFRLRNHGLPRREGGGRADLLATLSVDVPANVTDRERELFEELKKLGR
jgi:DnaJ-class molecular chaperone